MHEIGDVFCNKNKQISTVVFIQNHYFIHLKFMFCYWKTCNTWPWPLCKAAPICCEPVFPRLSGKDWRSGWLWDLVAKDEEIHKLFQVENHYAQTLCFKIFGDAQRIKPNQFIRGNIGKFAVCIVCKFYASK